MDSNEVFGTELQNNESQSQRNALDRLSRTAARQVSMGASGVPRIAADTGARAVDHMAPASAAEEISTYNRDQGRWMESDCRKVVERKRKKNSHRVE